MEYEEKITKKEEFLRIIHYIISTNISRTNFQEQLVLFLHHFNTKQRFLNFLHIRNY